MRKNLIKTMSIALSGVMIIGCPLSALAHSETDIPKAVHVYSDVKENSWYYEAVAYGTNHEYLDATKGYNEKYFYPDSAINRDEFVGILADLSGDDLKGYNNTPFEDVTNSVYNAAIDWAYENSIATGTSTTSKKFTPSGKLTREEMATFLYRFLKKYKKSGIMTSHGLYKDDSTISSWARDSVYALTDYEILEGYNNMFNPKNNLTKAEIAAATMRINKIFNFINSNAAQDSVNTDTKTNNTNQMGDNTNANSDVVTTVTDKTSASYQNSSQEFADEVYEEIISELNSKAIDSSEKPTRDSSMNKAAQLIAKGTYTAYKSLDNYSSVKTEDINKVLNEAGVDKYIGVKYNDEYNYTEWSMRAYTFTTSTYDLSVVDEIVNLTTGKSYSNGITSYHWFFDYVGVGTYTAPNTKSTKVVIMLYNSKGSEMTDSEKQAEYLNVFYEEQLNQSITLSDNQKEFVTLVNEARKEKGLNELKILPCITKATDIRAIEVCEVFSHTRPNGKDGTTTVSQIMVSDMGEEKWDKIKDSGFMNFGEVLTVRHNSDKYMDSVSAFNNFKNSPEHWKILMDDTHNYIGVSFGIKGTESSCVAILQ